MVRPLFSGENFPCFPTPNRAACLLARRAPENQRVEQVVVIPYRGEALQLLEPQEGIFEIPAGSLHAGEHLEDAVERLGERGEIGKEEAQSPRIAAVYLTEYERIYDSEEQSEAAKRTLLGFDAVLSRLREHIYYPLLVAVVEAIDHGYSSLV